MLLRMTLGLALCLLPAALRAKPWTLDDMVGQDAAGRAVYRARPLEERFKNPVIAEVEAEFQARARKIIAAQGQLKVPAGNTYFENEKRTYGYLMAQVLAGRKEAIQDLQMEDGQSKEWHRETAGIDFYACFTLKHQTRKYFYFGDLLEPAYRARMLAGAKSWTSEDPLRRPHFAYKGPGEGWGPDTKNSWVDVRSTENLYLMRVTSVYLFAEAAGNREVTDKYKQEIQQYARTLYRVGMGEWDSENYHGHSIGPLCNLYDFAQDDEVRLLAKACLDWVFAAGAVKYYRGGFNGPTKRDYNHVQPFGGSAASMLWLHFGACPVDNTHWESDEVHLITSAYRPPPAVIHLARKQVKLPHDIWSAKPHYSASTTGDVKSPPEYLETLRLGHSYVMGSLASGTSEDGGDVNGFKILAASERRGAVTLQAVPGPDAAFVGSPQYQKGKVSAPNRVAQFGHVAIWLVRDGRSPWRWVVPEDVQVETKDGVTFLKCDRTWVAVHSLGTTAFRRDDEETKKVAGGEKPKFPGHVVLAGEGNADKFCGLAITVGEAESHGSYAQFQQQALAAELDLAKLNEGIVRYKSKGDDFGFHWNDKPHDLGVWRNGERHDWAAHAQHLYRSPAISAPRGAGTLRVAAGGHVFTSSVDDAGQATFSNAQGDGK